MNRPLHWAIYKFLPHISRMQTSSTLLVGLGIHIVSLDQFLSRLQARKIFFSTNVEKFLRLRALKVK